jgi:hypothetical protein
MAVAPRHFFRIGLTKAGLRKYNRKDVEERRPSRMKLYSTLFCLALGSWITCALPLDAQAPGPGPTPPAQSSLTLVDGVAEQESPVNHGTMLLTKLQKSDLRLFDNRKEVTIQTFAEGPDTRPVALWLIVQCGTGAPPDFGSTFMKGKTQVLQPALQHLSNRDVLGVAHWCDDGQAKVDYAPGKDVGAALSAVEQVLSAGVANANDRAGQLALHNMVQAVVESTRNLTPAGGQSLMPVLLFLYGDQGGTDSREANSNIQALVESSGMVFGLSLIEIHHDIQEDIGSGQTFNQAHYYSRTTGGQYYSTSQTELFGPTLDYIVSQLHARYTLGFQPSKLDGKPHDLRVELTKDAQNRFPKTTLRFRIECFPHPPK